MSDYTLDDLVEAADGGGSSTSSGGSSDEPGGQWAVDLYDRLAESGRLDRILFGADGQREVEEIQAEQAGMDSEAAQSREVPPPEEHGGNEASQPPAASDGGSRPLSASELKTLMLRLYDNSAMIPGVSDDPKLSELIKLVDSQPETVDKLLEQFL